MEGVEWQGYVINISGALFLIIHKPHMMSLRAALLEDHVLLMGHNCRVVNMHVLQPVLMGILLPLVVSDFIAAEDISNRGKLVPGRVRSIQLFVLIAAGRLHPRGMGSSAGDRTFITGGM
jgi:hypothetical protein